MYLDGHERRFVCAIILRAARDALAGDTEALSWLEEYASPLERALRWRKGAISDWVAERRP